MKYTTWFPHDVKPVRAGVYEIKESGLLRWYRRWSGKRWYVGSSSVDEAAKETEELLYTNEMWRGLAKETK
jgi:hypothetical protein